MTDTQEQVLLICDGTVYTADQNERVIPHGCVLIMGDRIVAVGTFAEVDEAITAVSPAQRAAMKTVDARRLMVLPGFVNAHWHEMFATRLPLRPTSDRDDRPGFLGAGGDLHQISAVFDSFNGLLEGLTADEAEAIARYSMWTQLRSGVTTLGDVGSLNRPDAMVRAARSLGLRFVATTWAADAVCAPGEIRHRRTRDTDTVLSQVESLLKLCAADDSGRIRCRPTAVYVTNMTDELGRGLTELVQRHDVPFATHVGALRNEPEMLRQYYGTTGVRRLADLGLLDDRLMAVHCAFADDEERRLLLDAGAHISHSPAKYGQSGESTVTETRAIPELRRAGLDVSLSTDGSGLPLGGMVEAMRAAWQMYNELYADHTEVLPTDALAMATRIPAKGLRGEDAIGSLEPGKQADLVLIRTDDWRYLLNSRPLEGFLALGGSTDVDTVIVAGEALLAEGRATTVDENEAQDHYLEALRSFSVRCLGVDAELATMLTEAAR